MKPAEQVDNFVREVLVKVAKANNSLSDISSIALEQKFNCLSGKHFPTFSNFLESFYFEKFF